MTINPEKVLLVGDVHGSIRQLSRALDFALDSGVDTVVQLGDFGIWPGWQGQAFLADVNSVLETCDLTLLFVPGNHDDYGQINSTPVNDDGLQEFGSRLFAMPRGYRTVWQGLSVAALGGAHSVDRQWRLHHAPDTHWEAEHVTEEEAAAFAAAGPTDLIFMHDSPDGAPNTIVDSNTGAQFFPREELDLAQKHRGLLATAVNPTSPALIAHGHYHKYMTGTYRPAGATRDCTILGLSEGGERDLSQYVYLLDLTTFKETYPRA